MVVNLDDPSRDLSLVQLFFFWKLVGGDLENLVDKNAGLGYTPPILRMPQVVKAETEFAVIIPDTETLFDDTIKPLSLHQVEQRLRTRQLSGSLPPIVTNYFLDEYEPAGINFLEEPSEEIDLSNEELDENRRFMSEFQNVPLIIREKNIDYQLARLQIFQKLLDQYPYSRDEIIKEARMDIPPLLRGQIWAAVLGIKGDFHTEYENWDKDTETPTDRQARTPPFPTPHPLSSYRPFPKLI